MRSVTIAIEGMTCGGCVGAVRSVVTKVPGVSIKVLSVGQLTVAGVATDATLEAIKKGIEGAGFRVTAMKDEPAGA
jgi:Cu+-exporting ATPase